ncbi:MAG: glycosyltransferase family 4 protein [candidate division WOR-3 bacterium]|nr:glycosyltransferase family 4 protein [candidate division WOR-3 bacterium]
MRIVYGILSGGSGNDIYFNLLATSQRKLNNEIKFLSYHRYWSINPHLLRPFVKINPSYDIIHSNAEYGLAFYNPRQPLIISILHIIAEPQQTDYLNKLQKIYYQKILDYIEKSLSKANFVIAISKSTEQTARNLYDVKNIQTIYCGIDTELFKPIEIINDPFPDKIKLLFVGNLTRRKGVDLLPQIMARLDNRFLLFYTTGLRSPKKVFFDDRMIPLGRLSQTDLVYWYNLCDICLLPTRLEGFGYAIAEAMACAKPVISTNCSSLPELVTDGENGYLCKMDDVSDFVDKINLLADNKQMRDEIGIRNRNKIINSFNLATMAKSYHNLYSKIIKEFY